MHLCAAQAPEELRDVDGVREQMRRAGLNQDEERAREEEEEELFARVNRTKAEKKACVEHYNGMRGARLCTVVSPNWTCLWSVMFWDGLVGTDNRRAEASAGRHCRFPRGGA